MGEKCGAAQWFMVQALDIVWQVANKPFEFVLNM